MVQLRTAAFAFPLGGTGKENTLGTSEHVALCGGGNMSASAREPGPSFNDEPPDGSPNEDAPRGNAAIRDRPPSPIYDAPNTARQTEPKQGPTRPSLSTPGARAETTEASQPPWKQKRPRRAFAGDVAMAELR